MSRGSVDQLRAHCSRSGQQSCKGSASGGRRGRLSCFWATPFGGFVMRLISLLNHHQHFPGFVYDKARHCAQSQTIEITVRPSPRLKTGVPAGCHKPGPGYDHLGVRRVRVCACLGLHGRVGFIACAGSIAEPAGCMRRSGPLGDRASTNWTKAYMLFLAHWARKLSWRGDSTVVLQHLGQGLPVGRVCRAVGGSSTGNWDRSCAIGVDEIQYGDGHKYLTLVYQIEQQCTRLLWIGQERTMESFDRFFTMIGEGLAKQIQFVCSDMWKPYLNVIARAVRPSHPHPRPLPYCRQDERGIEPCACRRGTHTAGPGRLRTYLEKVPLVCAEAQAQT